MMHAMRRKLTTKEGQLSTMPHNCRIQTHGGGGRGSSKEAHHRYNPGAPMAPRSSDMPIETSVSVSAGDGSASSSSWVKPGCMMELARLAKIPQPESGLMCPRCRSTETKFCYYNNYSLSQPRHFCRTCRRYWTHGGALRDLPFSSSIQRRRRRNKSSNKHTSSKVASCASGTGARASSSSSSSGATVPSGRVEQLPLSLAPLDPVGGAERHRTGASRLWFPRHSSQDPVGYRQLGNSIGAATTIRPENQCYIPQRQPPFSFLGYKNAVTAATSAICPFSAEAGGSEAGSFAGQMQAISFSRVPGSAEPASEVMAAVVENPPIISSTETMMETWMSSLGEEFLAGLQGENDLLRFLGSGSWACGYGYTAGNGASSRGSSCTVAPGNAWPDPSGFASSFSGRSTIL